MHTIFHKAKQSIGWEPVARMNHPKNLTAGEELEYDYQANRWED